MIDLAVLAGGRSPEHDISLQSGAQVLEHLDRSRWRPWPVFIDRAGSWHVPDQPGDGLDPDAPGLRPGAGLDLLLDRGVQLAFPVLHGPFGEDGTLQGMLALHDVACVGSGTAAAAVAMDKIRTRECLEQAGVPMPRAWVGADGFAPSSDSLVAQLESKLGYPSFLKTDTSGSTLGVQRVENGEQARAFFDEYRHRARRFVAEAAVAGEEITVPVLGNLGAELLPLPPVGIYPVMAEHFTFAAKYQPGGSEEIVPPRGWNEAQIAAVQELALRCHRALACDGVSRTDMIITDAGPQVLEVNTIPGLTSNSLLPRAAAAIGWSFGELLDRMLELALAAAPVESPA